MVLSCFLSFYRVQLIFYRFDEDEAGKAREKIKYFREKKGDRKERLQKNVVLNFRRYCKA